MDHLEKYHAINETMLDQEHYFQALFQIICSKGMLNNTEIERIQVELAELLGKEIERYTNGESTSVPIEKAQEILQSVTYNIGVYLKSIKDVDEEIEVLKTQKVAALFYRGMDCVSALKVKAAKLLQNLQKGSLITDNIAYRDTVYKGIPEFFHGYNIEFEAHEGPGSIDYPLLDSIGNLLGVEYVYEYLHRLTIENTFLRHFSDSVIKSLLFQFNKDSIHFLINIFELVLTNAIGCELLEAELTDLLIPAKDLIWLQASMKNLSYEEMQNRINAAFGQVIEKLKLESDIIEYSKAAIPKLMIRLKNNLETETLNQLFIPWKEYNQASESFEDGMMLEDDRLRELIEELRDIQSVHEKAERIHKSVHNVYDFIELLEECFYWDEYAAVFKQLNKEERLVLKRVILKEAIDENPAEDVQEKTWQNILLRMEE